MSLRLLFKKNRRLLKLKHNLISLQIFLERIPHLFGNMINSEEVTIYTVCWMPLSGNLYVASVVQISAHADAPVLIFLSLEGFEPKISLCKWSRPWDYKNHLRLTCVALLSCWYDKWVVFRFSVGARKISFKVSRPRMKPTQRPIQRVLGLLSQMYSGWGVNKATYLQLLPVVRMSGATPHKEICHGVVYKDNFAFHFASGCYQFR